MNESGIGNLLYVQEVTMKNRSRLLGHTVLIVDFMILI